jgi:serine phosphatase RsbU (regulator of sigma subunit)
MQRLIEISVAHRSADEGEIAETILKAVEAFSSGKKRDDIAILAMRFL